jgi:hypothetical protein
MITDKYKLKFKYNLRNYQINGSFPAAKIKMFTFLSFWSLKKKLRLRLQMYCMTSFQ